ncbi:MAG: hypothetical protein KZQ83_06875 [gamma proteobacterium symbiont of Taylorina sp.]|nr:hypothetical protein [gamma proteobacterium symbiont of Taylorina sp.]
MITIEQLKSEIECVGSKNLEVLYHIIQLLQPKVTNTKDHFINPLKGSVTFEKDIISPIDEHWDADL